MDERTPQRNNDSDPSPVNPGYPLVQIAKALITAEQHHDPDTRERAQKRIAQWTAVMASILDGTLDVGSRTPVDGVPHWVTLEVVTGGFATGQFMAGGPLREYETALLATRPATPETDGRRDLNRYFVTDEGFTQLQSMLHSGCYDVAVPEEGALLVVAWLVENGYTDTARDVLNELGPWFSTLRFYPIPVDRPRHFGSRVFLQDVGHTIEHLSQIKPNLNILAQKEAIHVWAPLYDQTVSLFLETVDGEPPYLQRGPDDTWRRSPEGQFPVEGGWPCRHYPDGWQTRARSLLDEYTQQRKRYSLCGKPERRKESFFQLRTYLRQILENPHSLSGRDVGRIRLILARSVAKRGIPESLQCQVFREKQIAQSKAPTFQELANVVIQRLAAYSPRDGLDDISSVIQPITDTEAERWQIESGISIARSLQRKVERCLRETVDSLIERDIITSGETLANVLPQMTSGIRAAGIPDPTLRHLYAAIYRAFRRRRSLLLLNLEKQVQIDELPWIAAIDRFRNENLSSRELARQTLEEVTLLTMTSFPYAILPNKLLQELRSLIKTAKLDLPLVDEIAADIFMGTFSGKFLKAAKQAAALLDGTLYAIYYGIDYQQVLALPESSSTRRQWFRKTANDPFVELCESRAGICYSGWDPVANGMLIEQQQIVTSQNLASLFAEFNLVETLGDRLTDMAHCCFIWICNRLQMSSDQWHANLIQVKNAAYAWRQMIFFLAMLPQHHVEDFLVWADAHLNQQPTAFQNRFRPAMRGLVLAAAGCSLNEDAVYSEARRFLGWSKSRHWLLTDASKE